MSQEVGVSALGIATPDGTFAHVLLLCKPLPLAVCVFMNRQLLLQVGNATFLTLGNSILSLLPISSFATY